MATLAYVVAAAAMTMLAAGARAQGEDSESTRAHDAPLSMVVDLATQHGYVYRGQTLVAETPISSGKHGYRTPAGTFRVLVKEKFHRSKKYDNAPMPYMQRLTWSGLALHAGHVPGYPASHGCVRMPLSFARWLYNQPTMGMKVVILNESRPEAVASAPRKTLVTASRTADMGTGSREDEDSDSSE